MTNKEDKNKKSISGISSTSSSDRIEKAKGIGQVQEVKKVKGTEGVSAIKATGAINTKKSLISGITREQRTKIFGIIEQEAEKMAKEGTLPKGKKDLVKNAVLMAMDAAIILKDDES